VDNELVALGGAFLAAGLLARLGRRIGFPTIPFFMLAGIIFGPNTPGVSLVDDPRDLELLAALGLVLLLFHLGLEFSLGDLLAGGSRLLGIGAIYLALNVGGGFLLGLSFGWGTQEALVIAGAVGISSSAIVTKLLTELRRLANPESQLILGIIVVEDVFLALYLALLQPVLGEAENALEAALDFAVALLFLLALAAIARWGSRAVGRLVETSDDELLGLLRRARGAHRRNRGGARRLRGDRRVDDRARARRDHRGVARPTPRAPVARRVRGRVLLRVRTHDRSCRRG
jgi:CPA2 family monovalent cation:H+ antiporter-2